MAAGAFFEPGLSVQLTGCCWRPSSSLAVLEFMLSIACCCLLDAEGLTALADLSGESFQDINLLVGLCCSDLLIATSSTEVPFAGFLQPSLSTL